MSGWTEDLDQVVEEVAWVQRVLRSENTDVPMLESLLATVAQAVEVLAKKVKELGEPS